MSSRTGNRTYRANRATVLANNNICFICGMKIDMELKFPHPDSPSVDHVIPHVKGGDDSISNLRPAHLNCNRKKHSKDFADVRKRGGVDW